MRITFVAEKLCREQNQLVKYRVILVTGRNFIALHQIRTRSSQDLMEPSKNFEALQQALMRFDKGLTRLFQDFVSPWKYSDKLREGYAGCLRKIAIVLVPIVLHN